MISVTLRQIAAEHNARVVLGSRMVIARGTQRIGSMTGGTAAAMYTSVGGTAYPVFILGIHDPDDAITARWVP